MLPQFGHEPAGPVDWDMHMFMFELYGVPPYPNGDGGQLVQTLPQ